MIYFCILKVKKGLEGKEMCLSLQTFVSGRARIQIQSFVVPRSISFFFFFFPIYKPIQKRKKHKMRWQKNKIRCKEFRLLTAEQVPGAQYRVWCGCLKDLLSRSLAFLVNDLDGLQCSFLWHYFWTPKPLWAVLTS